VRTARLAEVNGEWFAVPESRLHSSGYELFGVFEFFARLFELRGRHPFMPV
jgi:hypothetical protein